MAALMFQVRRAAIKLKAHVVNCSTNFVVWEILTVVLNSLSYRPLTYRRKMCLLYVARLLFEMHTNITEGDVRSLRESLDFADPL